MTSPNVLLICTDQQRFDAVAAAGNPHVQTPNLDRLAAEGASSSATTVRGSSRSPARKLLRA